MNKNLARVIGLAAAIVYSELLSRHYYFAGRGKLRAGGYFYSTIDTLEFATTLSRHQQDMAIKVLVGEGLITTRLIGVPAKRHFRILDNASLLVELLRRGEQEVVPEAVERACEDILCGLAEDGADVRSVTPQKLLRKFTG